jgi:hypothetical protein
LENQAEALGLFSESVSTFLNLGWCWIGLSYMRLAVRNFLSEHSFNEQQAACRMENGKPMSWSTQQRNMFARRARQQKLVKVADAA